MKIRRAINTAFLPTSIDLGSLQTRSISIDNPSAFWLKVGQDELFVPPRTLGWVANFEGTLLGSVTIDKASPSSLILNPTSGGEDDLIIITSDQPLLPSAGTVFTGPAHTTNPFGQTAVGAGNYGAGNIPTGASIRGMSISGVVTVGIGLIDVYVTDGATSIRIPPNVILIPNFVAALHASYEFVPPLDLSVGAWNVRLNLSALSGVPVFTVWGIILHTSGSNPSG